MNRSCQRQTQVFDLPVRRMISLVPTPSALERMIAARQACFCEALRSLVIASSRPRTDRVIVMEIPVRMRQTRTATETEKSQSGFLCQATTTSNRGKGYTTDNVQIVLLAVNGVERLGTASFRTGGQLVSVFGSGNSWTTPVVPMTRRFRPLPDLTTEILCVYSPLVNKIIKNL